MMGHLKSMERYMSRSYPIWNEVEACTYKTSKSWGAKDTCAVTVNVGTSATYSETLVEHVTTRRPFGENHTVFTFGVKVGGDNDLKIIATKYLNNKTREFSDYAPREENV
jgi:hypothetical protein